MNFRGLQILVAQEFGDHRQAHLLLSSLWFEDLQVMAADVPGQLTRMESLIVQHGLQMISFRLKRDALKKE
jgi:hypothetical protein